METTIKNPFENALAILIEIHKWGTRRPVKTSEVGEVSSVNTDTKVDKAQLSMSKAIVKCDEYDAIVRLDRGIRASMSLMSLPAVLAEGAYLVPFKSVARARELIAAYREAREEAIDAFLRKYEGNLLDQEAIRLGPLFKRDQYPALEDVSDAFSVEISYPSFKPDGALKTINEEAYREALDDNIRRMSDAAEKIQLAMRAGLLKLIEGLSKALSKVREDGKPGIFHESTITNVQAWLDVFKDRNLTEDSDLDAIVSRCNAVLSGLSPEELRSDMDLRGEVVRKMEQVSGELSGLVKSAPLRKFSLEDLPDTGTDG